MPKDMRTFLDQLAREAPEEIRQVDAEVDPKRFGVAAVAAKLQQRDQYPALFFPRVKGSSLPVVVNLTATYRRLAMALDTTVERMVDTFAERQARPIEPVVVDSGPVQEVVLTGEQASLDVLPIPIHNEHDAAPFITSGTMVCRDPYTGALNVGLYRHQLEGPQQLGVWFLGQHHGGYVYRRHEEMGRPMEVAIVIGHHPAYVMGAISRVAGIGGEYAVAGGLLGEPLELVRAKTVNLLVPARAEIVIEGYMPPHERAFEGPFAEWPGHYVGDSDKPFIKVTAITMRRDAIYYDVMAAHREHVILGSLPRMGSILEQVRKVVPGVRAVNVPPHSRMHCYISIRKTSDAEVKKAAFQALLTEPENLKLVIVVDDDIDVYRDTEVLWAVGTRFKAEKGLLVIPNWSGPGGLNPVGYEFHADGTKTPVMTTAVVIDATKPSPPVPYPPRAIVPEEYVIPLDLEQILKDFAPGRVPAR